uniref:Uncharacterized protein n=1 Tax=viral metagenome TaxID=1070528 RepID=A0A6C0DS17_9ZZZZ
MSSFESILSHLGPTAQPLMSFLNNKEATELLTTSKYVAGFVAKYAARWGFTPAPFSLHADGGFTLRTSTEARRFRPLRHWEDLAFQKSSTWLHGECHYVGLVNAMTTFPLIIGSRTEIEAIRRAIRPYLLERRKRLPIEAAAKAKADTEAAAAAARAKFEATYTIRVGPPPAVNPWIRRVQTP